MPNEGEFRVKAPWRILAAAAALGLALWGAQFALRAAPGLPSSAPQVPDVLGPFETDAPVRSAQDWMERRAPILRAAFQRLVYGSLPAPVPPTVRWRRLIDADAFSGAARIEEWLLDVPMRGKNIQFHVLVFTPNKAHAPAPTVIVSNFCGNRAALAGRYKTIEKPAWAPQRCRTPFGQWTAEALHGADIIASPFEALTRAGYAAVTFFPMEIVADDRRLSAATLELLTDDMEGRKPRTGALAAWAWGYSRVVDALYAAPGFDHARIALWGHSRFGKAALLATAFDPRIAAVIANQSGTFGATLSRQSRGESISSVTMKFPHWFTPELKAFAGRPQDLPLDQHLLIALIAPRPILLGGASMDRWSDPANAFLAVQAAAPVYHLFGEDSARQHSFRRADEASPVALYLRPGGHGVRPRDWREAILFLDTHLKAGVPPVQQAGASPALHTP